MLLQITLKTSHRTAKTHQKNLYELVIRLKENFATRAAKKKLAKEQEKEAERQKRLNLSVILEL
jgi:hypothetical protein